MTELDKFFSDIDKLKHTEREGWIRRQVPGVKDTIASHSFGAALLGWALAKKDGLDENHVIRLLLMHDLVMAHIDDFTPKEKEYLSKKEIENRASEKMLANVPTNLRVEFQSLFREYQEGTSKEAMLAHECDKLDTLFQAKKYSQKTGKDELTEFIKTYSSIFKTTSGREALADLAK